MDSSEDKQIDSVLARLTRDAELFAKGGHIPLYPLAGWAIGTLSDDAVLLGVEFLTSPPNVSAQIIRFAITRKQCAQLAKTLERLAHVPHVLPPSKPS
jgi:hypothetical protein